MVIGLGMTDHLSLSSVSLLELQMISPLNQGFANFSVATPKLVVKNLATLKKSYDPLDVKMPGENLIFRIIIFKYS